MLTFLAGCLVGGLVVALVAGAGRLEARATEADLEWALRELEETGRELAVAQRENVELRRGLAG